MNYLLLTLGETGVDTAIAIIRYLVVGNSRHNSANVKFPLVAAIYG